MKNNPVSSLTDFDFKINDYGTEMGGSSKIYFMKKAFSVIVFLIGIFFLQNCSTKNLVSEEINRQWMLIEFQNFSRDLMVKNRAQIDLASTKTTPNQYGAEMGCNKMFFTAKFYSNGTVKFSDVGSTMMYCENNMELESAFGKELPKMTKYKIDGHHLTLSDNSGNTMKFVAADWD